jgi:hypothetical protein
MEGSNADTAGNVSPNPDSAFFRDRPNAAAAAAVTAGPPRLKAIEREVGLTSMSSWASGHILIAKTPLDKRKTIEEATEELWSLLMSASQSHADGDPVSLEVIV